MPPNRNALPLFPNLSNTYKYMLYIKIQEKSTTNKDIAFNLKPDI